MPAAKSAPKTPRTSATDKHEAALDEAAVLAGVPELLPPTKLRAGQRGRIIVLSQRLALLLDPKGGLDLEDPNVLAASYSVLGEADEFFETLAVDHDAYVEWAQGLADSEQIFAMLIGKYARAVGESTSSSAGSTRTNVS